MNNNQSIAIIVAIIVVGLFFYFRDAQAPATDTTQQTPTVLNPALQKTTTPAASQPKTSTKTIAPLPKNTVSYNNGKFSPDSLVVKAGESVTFLNSSNQSMWVMSGPDSYNSEYPVFNQERSVGKGGTYIFTFVNRGVFEYINKITPTAKGVIVVQ